MTTYRIKPLEWEDYGEGFDVQTYLKHSYGTWPSMDGDGSWVLVVRGDKYTPSKHSTLEAAKSAAQAHWEQQLSQVLEVVE